ncbi:plakophilin-1 [Ictalurus punctatus]|uniref:Plakophilin-1 n=1 Tax=Ictalurus punctatus TaxID=7998 RepID=A0A2D0RZ65_ICTPU|nr:plakophilin-1 [Ictalurus punctatus]
MTLEPLRSALSYGDIGETSLALPSDGASHSGQRRVMEQVTTMRKSKSKYTNRGSAGTLSPTSPKSDSVFYEYKFPSSNLNGSDFAYEGTSANGHTRTRKQKQSIMQRSVSTRSGNYHRIQNNNMLPSSLPALSQPSPYMDLYTTQMGSKNNTTHWSQRYKQSKILDKSHSHPPLTSPVQMIAGNSFHSTGNQFSGSNTLNRRPPSAHSNSEPKLSVASRKSEMNGMNGEANMSDITLSEAIYWISQSDERYKLHGASVIQHSTYTDDNAKEEVRKLKGIAPLVSLLSSSNPQIQLTSASALRNLVFKNSANKEEVRRTGGLTAALQLLRDTNSAETQKHVTGLLWNLSSEESIQPDLLRQALPVLTETVLQPNADTSALASDVEPRIESFCNATACLRNLSSGKLANRQALRNCEGLIDSLVTHMQSCVDNGNQDDKSVENCVCALHNLTYQLESEVPAVFSKIQTLATASESRNNVADTGPIGCFSNQSRKIQQESNSEYPLMDDFNPKGKSQLIHSKTLQLYLNLLGSTQNTNTQEACCGALHNLTAKKGIVSDVLSHTIVQRLNGLQNLSPQLQSPNLALKNSIITLIGNLSRPPQLHRTLARQALPGLVKSLTTDLTPESDSAMAVACHTANNLMRAEPEMGKKLLSSAMMNSLNNMSQNIAMPKTSKAAGALLHSLWSDKNIQSFLKKQGMNKTFFVNETTSAALRSLQIIE